MRLPDFGISAIQTQPSCLMATFSGNHSVLTQSLRFTHSDTQQDENNEVLSKRFNSHPDISNESADLPFSDDTVDLDGLDNEDPLNQPDLENTFDNHDDEGEGEGYNAIIDTHETSEALQPLVDKAFQYQEAFMTDFDSTYRLRIHQAFSDISSSRRLRTESVFTKVNRFLPVITHETYRSRISVTRSCLDAELSSENLALMQPGSIFLALAPEVPIALSNENSHQLLKYADNERVQSIKDITYVLAGLRQFCPSLDTDVSPLILRDTFLAEATKNLVEKSKHAIMDDPALDSFYRNLGVNYSVRSVDQDAPQSLAMQMSLRDIELYLKRDFPRAKFLCFGSVATGLSTVTSDCDISINNIADPGPCDMQAVPLDSIAALKLEMWQKAQENGLIALAELMIAEKSGVKLDVEKLKILHGAVSRAASVGAIPSLAHDTRAVRNETFKSLFSTPQMLSQNQLMDNLEDAKAQIRRLSPEAYRQISHSRHRILRRICHILDRKRYGVINLQPILGERVRVPLIKAVISSGISKKRFDRKSQSETTSRNPADSFELDICMNNNLGIFNSSLLRNYAEIDPRVGPLVQAVKGWFIHMGFHGAQRMLLSSYAITLMALFYLQNTPIPILPCLQLNTGSQRGKKYFYRGDVLDFVSGATYVGYGARNASTVHELFEGFFEFYSEFDFQNYAISVRKGRPIPKIYKKSHWSQKSLTSNHLLSIEDVLDVSHNLSGHVASPNVDTMLGAFRSMVLLNDFARFYVRQRTIANGTSSGVPLKQRKKKQAVSRKTYPNDVISSCHSFLNDISKWLVDTVRKNEQKALSSKKLETQTHAHIAEFMTHLKKITLKKLYATQSIDYDISKSRPSSLENSPLNEDEKNPEDLGDESGNTSETDHENAFTKSRQYSDRFST